MTGSLSERLLRWLGSIVLVFVCAPWSSAVSRFVRFEHELNRGVEQRIFGSRVVLRRRLNLSSLWRRPGWFRPLQRETWRRPWRDAGDERKRGADGIGKDVHVGHKARSGPDRRQPHATGTNRPGRDGLSRRWIDGLDGRRLDQTASITRGHGRHGPAHPWAAIRSASHPACWGRRVLGRRCRCSV